MVNLLPSSQQKKYDRGGCHKDHNLHTHATDTSLLQQRSAKQEKQRQKSHKHINRRFCRQKKQRSDRIYQNLRLFDGFTAIFPVQCQGGNHNSRRNQLTVIGKGGRLLHGHGQKRHHKQYPFSEGQLPKRICHRQHKKDNLTQGSQHCRPPEIQVHQSGRRNPHRRHHRSQHGAGAVVLHRGQRLIRISGKCIPIGIIRLHQKCCVLIYGISYPLCEQFLPGQFFLPQPGIRQLIGCIKMRHFIWF